MQKSLSAVFEKDLIRLKLEIEAYKSEEKLWIKAEGINNSAGNLCLHILGNLNNYIGTILGNTDYVRNRPAEFSEKTSKDYLLKFLDETTEMVKQTISNLDSEVLNQTYPDNVFGYEMKTEYFLIHLVGHLNYHLGQINYHRRILCYN
jgi:uncharacterized damage-inducible protein DinB